MGKYTGKQFVYLIQKQGRDIHPERKGMGILSNEQECSKSEMRQRHSGREVRASLVRRSVIKR